MNRNMRGIRYQATIWTKYSAREIQSFLREQKMVHSKPNMTKTRSTEVLQQMQTQFVSEWLIFESRLDLFALM